MAKKNYREALKEEFETVIVGLGLSDLQVSYVRMRWLDQVLWMEGKAEQARANYYTYRLAAIVAGLIVPALVGFNSGTEYTDQIRILTVILSLGAAISTGIESLYHYGDRWRSYRSTVELLKIEGWRYFELSGKYRGHKDHKKAFDLFSEQVEAIIQADIKTYREITKEKGSPDRSS